MKSALILAILFCSSTVFAKTETGLFLGMELGGQWTRTVRGRAPAKRSLEPNCSVGSIGVLTNLSSKYGLQLGVNFGELFGPCAIGNHKRWKTSFLIHRYFPTPGPEIRWMFSIGGAGGQSTYNGIRMGYFSVLGRVGLEVGKNDVRLLPHIYTRWTFGEGADQNRFKAFSAGLGMKIVFYM